LQQLQIDTHSRINKGGALSSQRVAPFNADIVPECRFDESEEDERDDLDLNAQRIRAKSTDPYAKNLNH
jgi:hypothetical protein